MPVIPATQEIAPLSSRLCDKSETLSQKKKNLKEILRVKKVFRMSLDNIMEHDLLLGALWLLL